MINKALFSSDKNNWETPLDLFKKYDDIYHFDLDVCADKNNHKCNNYFDINKNGLIQKWQGNCWMNPPYGLYIKEWIKKAYEESRKENCIVVALLPARTDTKWFHQYIYNQHFVKIEFLKGRLKFVSAEYSAPFPSMIVIFGKDIKNKIEEYEAK